jgi:hypothetical protein
MDYHIYYYFLKGDTTVGTKIYHKFFRVDSSAIAPIGNFYGGIREGANRKIFLTDFSNPEQLLYDFSSTNIGDTIIRGYNYNICKGIISAVDSVQLDNAQWRKRYAINAACTGGISYVIEGIGSTVELIQGPFIGEYVGWSFRCFHKNDTLVYSTDSCYMNYAHVGIEENSINNLFSISPNPSTGIFTLSSSEKISSIEISDVLGKQVYKSHASTSLSMTMDLSSQAKGIYFVKMMDEKGNFGVRKIVLQ